MSTVIPPHILRLKYEEAAEAYLRSLPPEHFMEATPQATQRAITLASLAVVTGRRPEVQVFNELLVQYPPDPEQPTRFAQVVPDNMVVLWQSPLHPVKSFNVPLQPAAPFWVMEYVSANSHRKDYELSFQKYESELKVLYYLLFYPDGQEMTLYRHDGRKYVSVKPNSEGRCAVTELEMEVAMRGGWVRFWFRGNLVPLPADLDRDLRKMRRRYKEALHRLDEQKHRTNEQQERAEAEHQRAEAEHQRANEQHQRAEAEQQRANEQHQRAEAERQRAEAERQRAVRAEEALARLQAQLAKTPPQGNPS